MNEIEGQKDYHMIRPMKAKDTDCVLEMMQVFYARLQYLRMAQTTFF